MRNTLGNLTIIVVIFSVSTVLFMKGFNILVAPSFEDKPFVYIGLSLVFIGLVPVVYKWKILQKFWWLIIVIGALLLFFALAFW